MTENLRINILYIYKSVVHLISKVSSKIHICNLIIIYTITF